jgi:hypothetical protein
MDFNLAPALVSLYTFIVGFVVGWFFPRGRLLKAVQLRLLKGLHNFFADEEEYIVHKAQKIRKAIKRK